MTFNSWKKFLPGLLVLMVLFTACQENIPEIKVIGPVEFQEKLYDAEEFILLDVRTPEEVEKGIIEGATVIDFKGADFKEKLAKLPSGKSVFVYCAAGGRSGKVVPMLKENGYTTIYDLEGGYGAWIAARYPIHRPGGM